MRSLRALEIVEVAGTEERAAPRDFDAEFRRQFERARDPVALRVLQVGVVGVDAPTAAGGPLLRIAALPDRRIEHHLAQQAGRGRLQALRHADGQRGVEHHAPILATDDFGGVRRWQRQHDRDRQRPPRPRDVKQ